MKTIYSLLIIFSLFITLNAASYSSAHANSTATVNSQASATVALSVQASVQSILNFGKVKSGSGTVVVNTKNKRKKSHGVEIDKSSFYSVATFNIIGEPNQEYTVQLPSVLYFNVQNHDGSTGVLKVNNFKSYSVNRKSKSRCGTLDSSGKDTFLVGARLIVPNFAVSGIYKGPVPLNISYQ